MSTLPGQVSKLSDPHDEVCEVCAGPASHAIAGETDGFGSESWHYCDIHLDAAKAELTQAIEPGICDWCHGESTELKYHRDVDEGSAGRVYEICKDCLAKDIKRLDAEIDD